MQYDAFFSRLSCSGWQHVGVALLPLLLFKTFIPLFLAEGLHFSLFFGSCAAGRNFADNLFTFDHLL